MNTPREQFEKSFLFDARRVVLRLKKGRVGEHIEKIVMLPEVQEYFTQELVGYIESLAAEMSADAKFEFAKMTTTDLLWQNFSVNLAMNAFINSLKKWFNSSDDDFDNLIIEFVTVDNAKKIIDALKKPFNDIALEVQAKNLTFDWSQYLKDNGGSEYLS